MRSRALFLLFTAALSAHAQVASERRYSLRHWSTADGLSHRSVNGMVKDRTGYLWLGTDAGLDRFDGYSFEPYGTAQGIRSEKVHTVLLDVQGRIWACGNDPDQSIATIDVLDPLSAKAMPIEEAVPAFKTIDVGALNGPTLRDADSSIYFGHVHGRSITRYTQREGLRTVPVVGYSYLFIYHVLADGSVICLAVDVGGMERYIRIHLDGRVEPFPSEHRWMGPFLDGRPGDGHALALTHCAPPGTCLLELDEQGLAHDLGFAPDAVTMNPFIRLPNGDVLAGSRVLAKDGHEIIQLLDEDPGFYYRLCALVDGTDRIWIGTQFGLFQINASRERFGRFLYSDLGRGPRGTSCRGMLLSGDTLMANTEDGFFQLNAHSGDTLVPPPDYGAYTYALARAKDGTHYSSRWNYFDITQHGRTRTLTLPVTMTVWSILPGFGNGVLLGCYGAFLEYDPASGTIKDYAGLNGHEELARGHTVQLVRTRDGDAWACTNSGLYRISPTAGVQERLWTGGDSAHALPSNAVHHLYEDAGGILWIATAGGTVRYDRTTKSSRTITRREGLTSNTIYAVYEDAHGQLWMPSDRGIIRYDKSTGAIRSYTVEDGITHDEFNRISHLQGPDGTLYFGGLNGITVFHPDSLHAAVNARPAPLVITRFEQMSGDAGTILEHTIEMLHHPAITLRPNDGFFELQVALLSYDMPALITYDWMIEGVDAAWNHQKSTSIRISRLPYGEHVLRIRARSGTSGPALSELTIPIRVLRPFYITWWFITLCLIALSAIAYAVFRYRLKQARTLFTMRDRIAMDLHDEVGSTLNSIALTASVARKRLDTDREGSRTLLTEIIANTGSTVDAMQDIVWAINSQHDELAHVIARMRAYGAKSCEPRDIRFHVEVDERLGSLKLDMAQRKNVYLMFKEALNNALKYAECRQITVEVKQQDGLRVSVTDDGKGFDPDASSEGTLGGNGLRNMRRRAEELKGRLDLRSAHGQGTTLTLSFLP